MNIEYSRQSIHAINDFPPEAKTQLKNVVRAIKENDDLKAVPGCKQLAGVPHGYRIDVAAYRLILVQEHAAEHVFLQLILPEDAVKEKEEELKARRAAVIREPKTFLWLYQKAAQALERASKATAKAFRFIGDRLPRIEIKITRKTPKDSLISESEHF